MCLRRREGRRRRERNKRVLVERENACVCECVKEIESVYVCTRELSKGYLKAHAPNGKHPVLKMHTPYAISHNISQKADMERKRARRHVLLIRKRRKLLTACNAVPSAFCMANPRQRIASFERGTDSYVNAHETDVPSSRCAWWQRQPLACV